MPGIYAEKSAFVTGVTQMGGRELRDAYTRTRKTFVGYRGIAAACYVPFRDYRAQLGLKLFTEALNDCSKGELTIPQAVSQSLENNPSIEVDTSELRKFSDAVMRYDRFNQHAHPNVRPTAAEIKSVGSRVIPLQLRANKLLTSEEIEALPHVTEERKGYFKSEPRAQVVALHEEDARFDTAIVDAFAHSAHFATRRLSVEQLEIDAAVLGALSQENLRVSGASSFPKEIANTYTRYPGVLDAAGLVDDGNGGYHLFEVR